jgi:hypothetical protein
MCGCVGALVGAVCMHVGMVRWCMCAHGIGMGVRVECVHACVCACVGSGMGVCVGVRMGMGANAGTSGGPHVEGCILGTRIVNKKLYLVLINTVSTILILCLKPT